MRLRLLIGAVLAIVFARHGLAQSRSGSAAITINVPLSADSAQIEERFVLASSQSPLELRLLTRPCVSVENVRFELDGTPVRLTQSEDGPWIAYRDSTASSDTIRLLVRYAAKRTGIDVIPLMHPAAALAAVEVIVRVDDHTQKVNFPHMTRQAPGEWSAHYVAVPSFVRVTGSRGECEANGGGGDNGGLVWRFFLLVGIMVAWVPLYLIWARRTGESA